MELKIKDHESKEISVEELVERYYKDPQEYFELSSNNNRSEDPSSDLSLPNIAEDKSKIESEKQLSSTERQEEQKENDNNSDKQRVLEDYLGYVQTAKVLQDIFSNNTKTIKTEHNISKKIFDTEK